jgi:hypothetical protein
MADDNSYVSKTIEDMRRQVAAKLDEARVTLAGLNAVELAFGLPLTQFGELLNSASVPPAPTGGASQTTVQPGQFPSYQRRSGQSVRPDEFLGEEPMQAAKKYMTMIGHAITFDEIADAIQRGGAAVHGANWREKLETSLMRSPYEVIKVADKTYGLAAFYSEDQLARLRGARRLKRLGTPKTKPKKKAAKAKEVAKKPESKSAGKPADKPPAAKHEASAHEPATMHQDGSGDQIH